MLLMLYGKTPLFYMSMLSAVLASSYWALLQGDFAITPSELAGLFWGGGDSVEHFVVWQLRMPRLLVGLGVGAALGVAGVIVQSITRNPLGSPDLMGVSGGAALAIIISLVLLDLTVAQTFWFGVLGGALAALVTFAIAWQTQLSPFYLTLAGMSVALFCFAGILIFLVGAADEAHGLYFWLIGGLADRTWEHVALLYPGLLVGLFGALLLARYLDLLMLDDAVCHGLGVAIVKYRLLLGIAAVVLTAAAVAVAGPIAFVGLVVPHAVRLVFAGRALGHRTLLCHAAVLGAVLIAVTDALARWQDVPVGVLTAVVGGPLFIALIHRYTVQHAA